MVDASPSSKVVRLSGTLNTHSLIQVALVLGALHPPSLKMANTKSASSPSASRPDQNNIVPKSDPLTTWVTRIIYLLITLATFSWLDTIKVSCIYTHTHTRRRLTQILTPRIDGMFSTQFISTSCSSPRSPHRPTTHQA